MTMQSVGRRLFAPVDPSDVSETRPRATIRPSIGRSVGRSVGAPESRRELSSASVAVAVSRPPAWMDEGGVSDGSRTLRNDQDGSIVRLRRETKERTNDFYWNGREMRFGLFLLRVSRR